MERVRLLDLKRVAGLLSQPIMIDLRNIYNPEEMRAAGFEYQLHRPIRCPGALSEDCADSAHSFDGTILREYDIRGDRRRYPDW